MSDSAMREKPRRAGEPQAMGSARVHPISQKMRREKLMSSTAPTQSDSVEGTYQGSMARLGRAWLG